MRLDPIDLMRRLNEEKGATFLFATHDTRPLDQASRPITPVNGRIADDAARDVTSRLQRRGERLSERVNALVRKADRADRLLR